MQKRKLVGFVARPVLLAIILALGITGVAVALDKLNVWGDWADASGANGEPYCVWYETPSTTSTNDVRYGDPVGGDDCNDHSSQSGFGINGDGTDIIPLAPGTIFTLANFRHYNNPITISNGQTFEQVKLTLHFDFDNPDVDPNLSFIVKLHETNNDGDCEYSGSTSCPDKVWFENLVTTETFYDIVAGKYYTLMILGYQPVGGSSCPAYDPNQPLLNEFITEEGSTNYACLYGQLVESGITVVKNSDPDHYRDFSFTMTSDSYDPQAFDLDDDEGCAFEGPNFCDGNGNVLSDTKNFPGLPAGTYTITESFDPNLPWFTSAVTCEGTDGEQYIANSENPGKGGSVVVPLAAGENIICTFENVSNSTTAVTLNSVTATPTQSNSLLWIAPVLAAFAAGIGFLTIRRRSRVAEQA